MRILVGQLWHESNWFNPLATMLSEFVVEYGEDVLRDNRNAMSALGGIIRRGEQLGVTFIPTISTRAAPSGPVDHQVYTSFCERILQVALEHHYDAVCLELHGAMRTTSIDDIEGDLLSKIREIRPDAPIAIALDLHGIVTDQMLEKSDICIGYKTNPHIDMAECGERCLDILVQSVEHKLSLQHVRCRVPLLITGNDETCSDPLNQVHSLAAKEVEHDDEILDISIFNSFQHADSPSSGQSVIVLSKQHSSFAEDACEAIATDIWTQRSNFARSYCPLDDAFREIGDSVKKWPYFLGDAGDRVLGGAPGDSTEILEYLGDTNSALPGLIPLYDPRSVDHCFSAGEGQEVSVNVGGTCTPGMRSIRLSGTVLRLTHGEYRASGPYMAGNHCSIGQSAVVRAGSLDVVLTTSPPLIIDDACFQILGVEPTHYAFVLVKSGTHFKINLSAETPFLTLDTQGLTSYRFDDSLYSRCRPMYPIDENTEFTANVAVFPSDSFPER